MQSRVDIQRPEGSLRVSSLIVVHADIGYRRSVGLDEYAQEKIEEMINLTQGLKRVKSMNALTKKEWA